jgi:predicted hydrocarbon binding protein
VHGLLLFTFVEFARERHGAALRGEPEYAADAEYPDETFTGLVERVAASTGRSRTELLREFGRHTALTTFPRLFPDYYAGRDGVRSFLLGVEDQIHEVVRATIEFARPPRLRVVPFGAEGVVISYTSERGLCDLLEGLVRGTADYYGEPLELEQTQCMHRGDIGCAFFVSTAQAEGAEAV